MPIYTYRCRSCGFELTKIQSFSDKPVRRCPACHTGRVRRVLQSSVIVFKGSGWYSTDHLLASGQGPLQIKKKHEAEGSSRETRKD